MVNRGGVGTSVARGRAAVILVLLLAGASFLLRLDLAGSRRPQTPALRDRGRLQNPIAQLPLAFEPNQGQADGRVKFLSHGQGYGLYLTSEAAVMSWAGRHPAALSLRVAGAAREPILSGIDRLPGYSNYLIGNDPARWHRKVPHFSRVRYRDLYPGIDLDFYGMQGRLEYDFEVYPGADPGRIELALDGANNLRLAANGDLVVELDGRELRFEAPHVYQTSPAGRQTVAGAFMVRDNRVGFRVGEYDRSRTLVIDPVLAFSSYLGGSGAESCTALTGASAGFVPHCPAVAVDSAARVYLAGGTNSTSGFPVPAAANPAIGSGGGNSDVFVARLSPSGSSFALDYLTYIGGSGTDFPAGVGVDSGFNVYLAGTTSSSDFPTTAGALQASATGTHAFVSKLDSSGSANLYSTYLGGSGTETASGLAVDSQGRAYLLGTTTSANFPVTTGALQATSRATNQFFFSKLDPNASGQASLQYSTYIGGSTPANGVVTGGAVAVDSKFNVYLAGGTDFTDMPVVNAFQGTAQGGLDAWVAQLNAPANNTQQYTPAYETYFGGGGNDVAYGVATDGTVTYVTGSTDSTITIPSGTSAFQSSLGGGTDAFVAKFTPSAGSGQNAGSVALSYFTYLGGNSNDAGLAIAADPPGSPGNVRVTGFTDSADFPVANNPVQGSSGGGRDAFVARVLTTTNSSTVNTSSASFLGGSGTDIGTSVAVDPVNTYVVGETTSGNFPTANALQGGLAGSSDTFVARLEPSLSGLTFICPPSVSGCPNPAPSNPTVNPTPVGVGNQITFTYSIYNSGEPVPGVLFTDNVGQPQNSTIVSVSASPGTCSSPGPGSASVLCNLGTIPTTTSASTPAKVTVSVLATAPPASGSTPPKPPDVGNSGTLSVSGTTFQQTASGTAQVNDFGISATTITGVVTAGATGKYSIQVTPTGPIPEAVSLACGSGLPAQATCSFSSSSSIPNLNNGPASRTLAISTTARVTTPASLFRSGGWSYALWLPISGLALLGSGVSRKRRWLLGLFLAAVLGTMALQAGCGGGSSSNKTTTSGTPAGTYTITVNATSGATRSTTVQLVVQ